MPNSPDLNKVLVSTLISRSTERKISKIAKASGLPRSSTISRLLDIATEKIELDEDDYRKIADDIAEEKARRARK